MRTKRFGQVSTIFYCECTAPYDHKPQCAHIRVSLADCMSTEHLDSVTETLKEFLQVMELYERDELHTYVPIEAARDLTKWAREYRNQLWYHHRGHEFEPCQCATFGHENCERGTTFIDPYYYH